MLPGLQHSETPLELKPSPAITYFHSHTCSGQPCQIHNNQVFQIMQRKPTPRELALCSCTAWSLTSVPVLRECVRFKIEDPNPFDKHLKTVFPSLFNTPLAELLETAAGCFNRPFRTLTTGSKDHKALIKLLAFDLTPSLLKEGRTCVDLDVPMNGWYPWEVRDNPDGSAWRLEIRALGSEAARGRVKDQALLKKVLLNAARVSNTLQAALLKKPDIPSPAPMNPWTGKPFEECNSLIRFSENEWRLSSKMETEVRIGAELNTRFEAFLAGAHDLEEVIHLLYRLSLLVDPPAQTSMPVKHQFLFLLLDIIHGELLKRCQNLRMDIIHDESKYAEIQTRCQELRGVIHSALRVSKPMPTTQDLMKESCCRLIRRAYGGGDLDIPPDQAKLNLMTIQAHLRDRSIPLLNHFLRRTGTALEIVVALLSKFAEYLTFQDCRDMMMGLDASTVWHLLQSTSPAYRYRRLIELLTEAGCNPIPTALLQNGSG